MKQKYPPLHIQWRSILFAGTCGLLVLYVLLFRLTAIAPRLMPSEQAMLATSRTWSMLLANPLHLPLKALQVIAATIPTSHTVLLARLPSILIACIAFISFLYITRRWYGRRNTFFGCILFVASAWFLHVSRFAGTDIEYVFGILALLGIHVALHDHTDRPLMAYLWLITNLILLFIPGFIWFILLSTIWQWRTILTAWRHLGTIWNRLGWILVKLSGIAALTYTFVKTHSLLRAWLGVPIHISPWQMILRHIGQNLLMLMYRGPNNPQLWLGRLPFLDIFLSTMFLAGIVFYAHHWRAQRTHLLFSYLILGIVLAGVGNIVPISVIMPIVYIIIVGGIAYVLHFWLRVFPRNPVARSLGMAIIGILVALSCLYSLKQYFVAWPHNHQTVTMEQRVDT